MKRGRRSGEAPGVLLVDKPAGPSSHAVVDWIRWVLRESRVGHCGTLDPAATGLLVVVVGAATRVAQHLTEADKCYRGRFVLGSSTTTADAQGDILERAACGPADEARALEAIDGLVGTHALAPPRFSAVKVGGVAAHVRARAGGDGDVAALAPRTMSVRWIDDVCAVAGAAAGTVAIEATLEVSKGTYIRSLAELLGLRVGCPAHLGALRRLRCGASSVDDARAVGPLQAVALESGADGKPRWRIRPADEALAADREAQAQWLRARMLTVLEAWPLPWIELPRDEPGETALRRLVQGQAVELAALTPAAAALTGRVAVGRSGPGGPFLVARVESGALRPERTVLGPNAGDAA